MCKYALITSGSSTAYRNIKKESRPRLRKRVYMVTWQKQSIVWEEKIIQMKNKVSINLRYVKYVYIYIYNEINVNEIYFRYAKTYRPSVVYG